jgi:2-methylcitrate dehydratase PrpD
MTIYDFTALSGRTAGAGPHEEGNFLGSAPELSRILSSWLVSLRSTSLPDSVWQDGERTLINLLAAGLGGAASPEVDACVTALLPFSGQTRVGLIGRSEALDALNAAFVNAIAINVLDFDDTHIPTVIHPGAPVGGAVLALGEALGRSGETVLRALIAGTEVACRIGNAVSPDHYKNGWHITGTCGVFGAAAGCAMLLGLSVEQTAWALGHAAMQSSGSTEALGSMSKSVTIGNAARGGMAAALYAQAGLSGHGAPLEGAFGFLNLAAAQPRPERVIADLGHVWEISANTFKPYPCGVVMHPVIDACLLLRASMADTATIRSVRVTGSALLQKRADRPHPASPREAQVSVQHAVAVALLRGRAGPAEFGEAALADGDVRRVSGLVSVQADPAILPSAAKVDITFQDDQHLEHAVSTPRGSLERPLTDADLREKFAGLAAFGAPHVDSGTALGTALRMRALPDITELMTSLRPIRG